jgi:hypothetical protein
MTQTAQIAAEMDRIRSLVGRASKQQSDMLAAAQALEARLRPAFRASLEEMSLSDLKVEAKRVIAYTRGCRVRKDFERAIEKVWRSNVWDAAGYRYGPRPKRVFEINA